MNTLSRYLLAILCCVFVMDARSEVISNVQFSHPSPSTLAFLQHVDITFDYVCQFEGGVRIFFTPMTGGGSTPNYAVSPSPVYPVGHGSGTGFITVVTGNVVVDQVQIRITNHDQSELLLETYIPVDYRFSAHSFSNIVMTPASPTVRQFNTNVNLTFNYTTTEAGGVRIQALPYAHGGPTPYYSVTPSPLYPVGGGSVGANLTITAVEAIVDSVQFCMYTADWSQVLLELFVPVRYHFANNAIGNVRCNFISPASLPYEQLMVVTFNYTTNEAAGVLAWPRPFTDGSLTPEYSASGSPVFPMGNGTGSGQFAILSDDTWVDSIRVQMMDIGQTTLLAEYFEPVTFHWGVNSISNIQLSPASPAYFTNNQRDTIRWDYTTTESGGVRFIALPLHGEVMPDHHAWSGSTVLPTGAGSGSSFFTFTEGTAVIDNMRFRMYNSDLSEVLLELFVPVDFQFISTTPVGILDNGSDVPNSFGLAQNYPNPFNPVTTIGYSLPKQTRVTLRIYDVLGRELATLVNETQSPGRKSVEFDAGTLSSGVYYYRLEAGNYIETKKLILLK